MHYAPWLVRSEPTRWTGLEFDDFSHPGELEVLADASPRVAVARRKPRMLSRGDGMRAASALGWRNRAWINRHSASDDLRDRARIATPDPATPAWKRRAPSGNAPSSLCTSRVGALICEATGIGSKVSHSGQAITACRLRYSGIAPRSGSR
jgi:hypothetical protein